MKLVEQFQDWIHEPVSRMEKAGRTLVAVGASACLLSMVVSGQEAVDAAHEDSRADAAVAQGELLKGNYPELAASQYSRAAAYYEASADHLDKSASYSLFGVVPGVLVAVGGLGLSGLGRRRRYDRLQRERGLY